MTAEEREVDLTKAANILAVRAIHVILDESGRNPVLAHSHLMLEAEVFRRAAAILEKAATGTTVYLNRVISEVRAA